MIAGHRAQFVKRENVLDKFCDAMAVRFIAVASFSNRLYRDKADRPVDRRNTQMKSAQIERRRQAECGERGRGASGAV